MYHHRDIGQSTRVRLVVNWLEEMFDQRVCPWFRPEFVHPNNFAAAADPPGGGRQRRRGDAA